MTSREASDLIVLAIGAYTPLTGFMGKADWHRVCAEMRLTDDLFWPIPITPSANMDLADSIGVHEVVALVDETSGEVMALMEVAEKYGIDKGGWIHNSSATPLRFSRKASAGVLKPRHFLGVEFKAQVSSAMSRSV